MIPGCLVPAYTGGIIYSLILWEYNQKVCSLLKSTLNDWRRESERINDCYGKGSESFESSPFVTEGDAKSFAVMVTEEVRSRK